MAHWTFDNETKFFYFKVEVNATGWVAFGVSRLMYPTNPDLQWNFNAMEYYDVIVGGVLSRNNTKYFKDCLTDGHKRPKVDKKQDWTVTSLSEINGTTTMEFNRKQNTTDTEGDNVIGPGLRRIVWAYHDTSDDIENDWLQHSEKGFHEISLLTEPPTTGVTDYVITELPTTGVTDYVTTEPPTTGATAIAASIIGNLLLIFIVVIFLY